MYLQITTKCNMSCKHCCYSCTMKGKHGALPQIIDNIRFASDYSDCVAIGGGEPTLHPDFFEILRRCIDTFSFVWMATNGSQTNAMYRLVDIINGHDYPECNCAEELEPEEFEEYGCLCHEKIDLDCIIQEGKLTVALSRDPFHDPIDPSIVDIWTRQSYRDGFDSHFVIMDVTKTLDGVSAQGRAKKTGVGFGTHCVCPDVVIKPDGRLKLCGCITAPFIGHASYGGIESKWERLMQDDDGYRDSCCYKSTERSVTYYDR